MQICIVTNFSFSQSYFHSPNDTLVATATLDYQVTMNITQVHPTNDTIQFIWDKLSVSMPNDWVASICDNSNCYPSLENHGQTLPVLPGDDGLMLLHCTPQTLAGTGIIRYTIYEISSPQNVDTLTWIINVNELGVSKLESNLFDFTLINNSIHFQNAEHLPNELSIVDLTGKMIFSSKTINDQIIDLPILKSAQYIINLTYDTQILRKKIWIQN